ADDGRAVERAVAAGIRDRERSAGDVVRRQLLLARAPRDLGDRSRNAEEVEPFRVLHDGNDQPLAVGELDGEPEVDVVPRDDLVAADLAVDPRVLPQGLDDRTRDEGEVRRIDAVRLLVLL